jgi:hypothetical protein
MEEELYDIALDATCVSYDEFYKNDHTIIYIDWDDTLSPTTYFTKQDLKLDIDEKDEKLINIKDDLDKLSDKIISVLDTIKNSSTKDHPIDIYIVTNAELDWVELSSKKFLPKVYEYLAEHQIDIVSAKTLYHEMTGNKEENTLQYVLWKYHAFLYLLKLKFKDFNQYMKLNLISIGDSTAEKYALQSMKNIMINCIFKTVKLKSNPTFDELDKGLSDLMSYWKTIHSCDDHTHIDFPV